MALKFDVALGTSVVVFAFDGQHLKSLVGAKSVEPYKGAPMLPTNWVKANESVEDVAKRMITEFLVWINLPGTIKCVRTCFRNPMGRVVNIAYYALLNWDEVKDIELQAGYRWVSYNEDEMIFAHEI